jgi:DNA-binding beta-propeller fold protein YncE
MVQRVLSHADISQVKRRAWLSCLLLLLTLPATAAKRHKPAPEMAPPDLLLEGGRRLSFERSFSSQRDAQGKQNIWSKLLNGIAGEPDYKQMVRPYSIAVDSRGRMIVTDPGMGGIHIFDLALHKYKFLERTEKSKDNLFEPQCVAVDAKDNIYVTDSKSGKIFVFNADGKYQGALGSLKGGEGFFKRPTGIAIDDATQHIYVTDTLRDKIYVLDSKGAVLRTIGKRGSGDGEFNYPTELRLRNGLLAVVDAMNFRVQIFDSGDRLVGKIGQVGDSSGQVYRPKGIAIDSEDHIYLVEGLWGTVQVFNREGQLLYTFGQRGTRLGDFQLPAGLFIDKNDGVYVVDSYNRRVQVFQYHGLRAKVEGPTVEGAKP